jgi:hypothetical protein
LRRQRGRRRQGQTSADHWRKQDEERKASADRWRRLKPYALAAVAKKIKVSAFTDKLAKSIIEDMVTGPEVAVFRELLGGTVTIKNFSRAVALADVLERAWSEEPFKPIAKKYGDRPREAREDHSRTRPSRRGAGKKAAK